MRTVIMAVAVAWTATLAASVANAGCSDPRLPAVRDSILGRHCHVGRNATLEGRVVLGDKSVITDYSRL